MEEWKIVRHHLGKKKYTKEGGSQMHSNVGDMSYKEPGQQSGASGEGSEKDPPGYLNHDSYMES